MSKRPRKKGGVLGEYILRESLANRFKTKLGDFYYENTTKIVFPDSGKNIFCICSSFYEEESKWFWGIPKKYWTNWQNNDLLALVLQNETGGYSFILLTSQEAKALIDKLGMDKYQNKKINMRIYKEDDEVRFEKDKRFDVKNRMKTLKIDF